MTPGELRASLGGLPSRVLVLGARASEHAGLWEGHGSEVRIAGRADGVLDASEAWDVVILDGALERERWDRWLLQRLHRALRPGGRLLVRTDHLFDLGSREGLGYLVQGALKQLRRRLAGRAAIPVADRSGFRGRRYAPRRLAAMLAGVSLEPEFVSVGGAARDPRPDGAPGPPRSRTGRFVFASARKIPSLWGASRPFPEPSKFRASFRASHAEALAARDDWARRSGSRPPVQPLDVARLAASGALVFSPHPDDEVIGCGGTLLDLAARGGPVTVVQVTDGSDSAAFIDEPEAVRRQIRLDEAERVARRLGARELVCLRADNRALRSSETLRAEFRRVLERVRPGIVFAPSFTDIHPDHQTVLRLLAGALEAIPDRGMGVALYEVWSLVAPTHLHPVDARIGDIEELLLTYETALKIDDYVHLVAERLLFNALEHAGRTGYVEAFEVHSAGRFLELARHRFASTTVT
jgi:LmbE family N-acetylglucosaminyl deacetylase